MKINIETLVWSSPSPSPALSLSELWKMSKWERTTIYYAIWNEFACWMFIRIPRAISCIRYDVQCTYDSQFTICIFKCVLRVKSPSNWFDNNYGVHVPIFHFRWIVHRTNSHSRTLILAFLHLCIIYLPFALHKRI